MLCWRATTILLTLFVASVAVAQETNRPLLPQVAAGWKIELICAAPDIHAPTAVVESPRGTIFLGQDPMDMNGPPTVPHDSVVMLTWRDGRLVKTVFADQLWAVMGLELIDETLYVVHAPFLSSFRDTNGDGRADQRVDLVTGLGPKLPAFSGYNDHVPSGMRVGMDGFLYLSVGDKGIPRAVGRDGKTISLRGGGVVRVRPDGTDLEIVSTGLRNPLSVALNSRDDVFTYGNLFFCDFGRQTLDRFEVEPVGGTYRLRRRTNIVSAGKLGSFRPFSAAVGGDGNSILITDWTQPGQLVTGATSAGRLFRLTYDGPDAVRPKSRLSLSESNDLDATIAEREVTIAALGHPSRRERLRAQRALIETGEGAIPPLLRRLNASYDAEHDGADRLHALWALDAIGGKTAGAAIRKSIDDADSFTAWSIRQALKRIRHWDADQLAAAVLQSKGERQRQLLVLMEDVWNVEVVKRRIACWRGSTASIRHGKASGSVPIRWLDASRSAPKHGPSKPNI